MEEALFRAPPFYISEEAKLKQKHVKKVREMLKLRMTRIWNKINSQNVSNHVKIRMVALALICSFLVYLWSKIVQKMKIGGPLQGF